MESLYGPTVRWVGTDVSHYFGVECGVRVRVERLDDVPTLVLGPPESGSGSFVWVEVNVSDEKSERGDNDFNDGSGVRSINTLRSPASGVRHTTNTDGTRDSNG